MIGLSDKEKRERKKERLSFSAIAKASFERSSYAAFLPGSFDQVVSFYDPQLQQFNYRSSGLETNFLTGNPTYQLLLGPVGLEAKAKSLTQSGLNPDIQMTRGKARSLLTAFPFANAIGVQNAIRIATEDLPTKSRVD